MSRSGRQLQPDLPQAIAGYTATTMSQKPASASGEYDVIANFVWFVVGAAAFCVLNELIVYIQFGAMP
jgi:hypothetical protein